MLTGCVIGGGAGDLIAVVAAVRCHVGSVVGRPVDGVQQGVIFGVDDGVVAAMVANVESLEGLGMRKHCELHIFSVSVMDIWSAVYRRCSNICAHY